MKKNSAAIVSSPENYIGEELLPPSKISLAAIPIPAAHKQVPLLLKKPITYFTFSRGTSKLILRIRSNFLVKLKIAARLEIAISSVRRREKKIKNS